MVVPATKSSKADSAVVLGPDFTPKMLILLGLALGNRCTKRLVTTDRWYLAYQRISFLYRIR